MEEGLGFGLGIGLGVRRWEVGVRVSEPMGQTMCSGCPRVAWLGLGLGLGLGAAVRK